MSTRAFVISFVAAVVPIFRWLMINRILERIFLLSFLKILKSSHFAYKENVSATYSEKFSSCRVEVRSTRVGGEVVHEKCIRRRKWIIEGRKDFFSRQSGISLLQLLKSIIVDDRNFQRTLEMSYTIG